jgi:hypothetical protein
MTIIEIPYIMALRIPAALVLLCFVKKLTVMGIIGKHMVSIMLQIQTESNKKMDHKPLLVVVF